MKKLLLPLILVISLTLFACTAEKKIIVQGAEPEDLFIRAQAIFREKMPTAKVSLDMDKRYIKAVDSRTLDYPSVVELRFKKEGGDTVVDIKASGDQQRLENLGYILRDGLNAKKATSDTQPITTSTTERPGHAVTGAEDLLKDFNKDGWISPKEEKVYRKRQLLEKEALSLEGEE